MKVKNVYDCFCLVATKNSQAKQKNIFTSVRTWLANQIK